MTYTNALTLLAGVLAAACAVLVYLLIKAKKAPAPTLEAKDLLANVLRGNAIVQIRVIDPENLMLRSPRG